MKTRKRIPLKNKLVVIKKSKIEGLGVFASVDITKGTKISDYYGKEMKWKTFKKRYGDYKTNSLHTYPMRRIWKILVAKEEPYKSKNLTNYINEIPGKANCELKLRALYAKKNIKKGDELLLDYPKDYNRFWLKLNKTRKNSGGSRNANCEKKCMKI
jgi:SET domain-containing protein